MIHAPAEPIMRTTAVQRCAVEIVEQIASTGRPLLAEMQSILERNLGTSNPLDESRIPFGDSSLLVQTLVGLQVAEHLKDAKYKVTMWLNGAPLNETGV